MEAIPLPDASVDFIVANHVMEHVDDLELSLEELKRVLRSNGEILITIPIDWNLKYSYAVDGVNDETVRLRLFGAKDHVRQFGSDFPDILRSLAFDVEEFKNSAEFRARHRINNDEDVLFILRK